MCRLDCPDEEQDRVIGFCGHKIGPVVFVKAENFFTGLSVQFSLRILHDNDGYFVK
jgi:hypothetical protein